MIYPTIYRYNAQYRGPKNNKDISSVVTSVSHDILVVANAANEHSQKIDGNVIYAMNKNGECHSNLSPVVEMDGEIITYQSVDSMISKLSSMDVILDNVLKNL